MRYWFHLEIMYNLEKPINDAVFPGLQGGPHNHSMAGVGVGLKQVPLPIYMITIVCLSLDSFLNLKLPSCELVFI